jgi:hydrogenase-4 component C
MEGIIVGIVQALIIVAIAPLISGFARWFRSKMHSRRGPSVLQDYYDIAKLFKRQDISPECSSFVHRLMPILFFGVTLVLAFGIPMITRVSPIAEVSDIILIIYLLAIPRFFFALASLDSGDVYASTGGVRELLVGVLVEPSMMLALIVAALATGTTSLSVMGVETATLGVNCPFAFAVAGIAFACACYVELGKVPFDMAEAEQEIQEGPLQEYSGPSLALVKMAMAMKQIIVVSWFLAIFIPWGSAVDMSFASLAVGLVVWLVKLFVCFFLAGIFENSVMRTRYHNLGKPTWTIVGISVCAFVLFLVGV